MNKCNASYNHEIIEPIPKGKRVGVLVVVDGIYLPEEIPKLVERITEAASKAVYLRDERNEPSLFQSPS